MDIEKEIDYIIIHEIEYIKKCPHWITAWWTPDYAKVRREELLENIKSKNQDIEYIGQHNPSPHLTEANHGTN